MYIIYKTVAKIVLLYKMTYVYLQQFSMRRDDGCYLGLNPVALDQMPFKVIFPRQPHWTHVAAVSQGGVGSIEVDLSRVVLCKRALATWTNKSSIRGFRKFDGHHIRRRSGRCGDSN